MSEDGPFVFFGEALSLDLINTVQVIRGRQIDTLQTPDDLAHWWSRAQAHHPQTEQVLGADLRFDADELANVKQVRDDLHALFVHVIQGEAPHQHEMDTLNRALTSGHPAVKWDGRPQAVYESAGQPATAILLPVALSALRLLTQSDLSRLHQCRNNQCVMLFYDTTKSGTRHYCSTACMDRERSRRRYQESKGV